MVKQLKLDKQGKLRLCENLHIKQKLNNSAEALSYYECLNIGWSDEYDWPVAAGLMMREVKL